MMIGLYKYPARLCAIVCSLAIVAAAFPPVDGADSGFITIALADDDGGDDGGG
jgi:hypothetical protein